MFKVIACILTAAATLFFFSFKTVTDIDGDGERRVYLYKSSSAAKEERLDEGKIYFNLKAFVKGESAEFSSEEKAMDFISSLEAEEVFSESGEDFYNVYYYTPRIDNYILINGNRVNLQFSRYSKVVGTPIIFGSY